MNSKWVSPTDIKHYITSDKHQNIKTTDIRSEASVEERLELESAWMLLENVPPT